MPSLLLEIGAEELPAGACREAEAQLPELARAHVGKAPSQLFVGPRRIGFLAENLSERTEDEWVKGPPESLRDRAAAGFAKKHGVSVEELEVRDGFLGVTVPGRELREVLPEQIDRIVRGFSFTKSMRWDASGMRFARPVRWVLAMLDAETILGETSFGHRFTHGPVEIPSAAAYADQLRAADVEPVADERRRQIVEGLDAVGGWSDPGGKLAEVVHLVEKPIVLESRFDERFLQLPERVVVTTMQSHQRYFPIEGNRFALVANGGEADVVAAGHSQVLEARLEDATFTFERDVATKPVEAQYLPDSSGGPLAQTDPGKVLAAADKLDTLRVAFELGHRPSGSRDPYGLRRAAIGVVRLALEGGLTIERELLPEEVLEFVEERLESLLDVPVEYVRAARASSVSDLGGVARRAEELYAERETPEFEGGYTAYDRAHRLAGKAQEAAAAELDRGLLGEDAEKALAEALAKVAIDANGDLKAALQSGAELAPVMERFFDEVLVMVEDEAVRANRLRLLLDVRDTLGALGDFSQIPR